MKNILNSFIRSIPLSICIITIGYLITFVILQRGDSLDLTLFIVGAIPIIIFLPSVFSQSKSGALHTPKVIFRKVNSLERPISKETENIFPALSYVFAGLVTWIFSLVIY